MRERPARRIDEVTPGYYRIRLTKGGHPVAAQISIDQGLITVTVNGEPDGTPLPTDQLAETIIEATIEGEAFRHPVLRVAWFGTPIDEAEYRHLLRDARWAKANNPKHPAANPERRVDLNKLPIKDIF